MPVLVLAHSLGVNLHMWEPQLEALAGHFRLLRYDVRGHGLTGEPDGAYTAEELGRDVVGLLDALGIVRASFCGLSMGGVIGQWLGIHAGERLERLVLANTAAKIGTAEGWNARIATVLREGLGPVIEGTLERWFTAGFRAEAGPVVGAVEAMLRGTSAVGYAGCCAAIRETDFRGELGRIQTPTLVIAGRTDPVTSVADGLALADGIERASFVELEAAHLSNVEAAERFSAAVWHFLSA
jgi:3-oxoadipate enol-lactonase